METGVRLSADEARQLAIRACRAAGGDEPTARSLADATLAAHRHGHPEVGFAHFVDYLSALKAGRINGSPRPAIDRQLPAFWHCDADGGIAQLGFDLVFDGFVASAQAIGLCAFTQRNSFTTGELGYYVRRLAEKGLVALAFTNANAFLSPAAGLPKVYSTNPMAFAYPLGSGQRPVVIDQSSSATAFVNVASAARRGLSLEPGIAVDARGEPTLDPVEAMRGALLPFGGRKGANIALMVELMAAGLAGASWSEDMPDFQSGAETLDAGLTVIALVPGKDPAGNTERAAQFVDRLKARDVYVPGTTSLKPEGSNDGSVVLDAELHAAILSYL